MIFFIQIFSGFFLFFFFRADGSLSFNSVQYLMMEVNYGWIFRLLHFNMVSIFFVFLFLHIFKALFYFRYRLKIVWIIGLLIFFLLILESFLGYTLIWSQISFWAATVITSLLRVIPFFGLKIIIFFWCGFYLNSFSLKFFFFLHFILPILIFFLIFFHVIFLHRYGRSTKINSSKLCKRSFFPFYWVKDFCNFFIIFLFFLFFLLFPFSLNESLSFVSVNNLVSPIHIVPEWYFLWVYAILRSFSIKWLGVFIIVFSIVIFFFLKRTILRFDLIRNFFLILFFFNFLFLTWLGFQEPIYPFVELSYFFILIYFFLLFLLNL